MSQKGFLISPKKWLGDVNIIKMDWDAKAMHIQLLCYAYQQDPQGYLLEDENLIRKLLENPNDDVWNRVKPQIFSCWKSKTLNIDGVKQKYFYNPELIKSLKEEESIPVASKTNSVVKEVKRKTKGKGIEFDDQPYEGFDLVSLTKYKATVTILFEKGNEEDKSNIWELGISLLERHGASNAKARGFLSSLVKKHGEPVVSSAVAKLSIQNKPIVDVFSYLNGIISQEELRSGKKTNRSFVL